MIDPLQPISHGVGTPSASGLVVSVVEYVPFRSASDAPMSSVNDAKAASAGRERAFNCVLSRGGAAELLPHASPQDVDFC
jgi:hypothetical protein